MNQSKKFTELFNAYQDMVFTLCLGYSKGDRAQAEDLVQDVFTNVWSSLPKFEERASSKTWIYRICVNTCLLHIRKSKKHAIESFTEGHHFEASYESKNNYQELYTAIGQLEELDRIIIMFVLESIPYKEISEIIGLSEGNIRVKISRIKKKLNTLLRNGR